MEQHSNTFEKLVLSTFTGAKLYRASDIPGRGWNTYGSPGIVRIEITKSGDYQGWGVLTFHNQRIGVLGLNVLLVPNFVMDHSIQHPRRLTFKAQSRSLGNNGKKNMYSLKMLHVSGTLFSFCSWPQNRQGQAALLQYQVLSLLKRL